MNFARALVRDLVDKRLWPLAVLLFAALVAVPLLLGGGGGTSQGSPLPAAALAEQAPAAVSQSTPAVQLVGPASVRSRPGKVRDPFRRPPKPKVDDASGAAQSASKGSDAGTSTTATTAQPTAVVPATPVLKPFAYRTEVRFGSTERDAPKARAISRLTPLGGLTDPALLYLGVSADGQHATFLLGPAAQQTGEGTCVDEGCRIIVLKAGDTSVVDVTPAEGEPRQYSLEVVSVELQEMASDGVAGRARAHVHPDGRDVLRDLLRDGASARAVGKIGYDQDRGVLEAKSAP